MIMHSQVAIRIGPEVRHPTIEDQSGRDVGESNTENLDKGINSASEAMDALKSQGHPVPSFLMNSDDRVRCDADDTWYSCSLCSHSRLCASNPGLLHCACTSPSMEEIHNMLGDLSEKSEAVLGMSPCLKVDVGKKISDWKLCESYLKLPLDSPHSDCAKWIVPRILHAVGKDSAPPQAVVMNAAASPDFRLHYLGDAAAKQYVRRHCGEDAGRAYDCFVAPAFRADLARYCFLFAEGGVYLDTDMILARPLPQIVSMCKGATIGHDIPQLPPPKWIREKDKHLPGKQMKILAGVPRHPLFKCMLDTIVDHVRTRYEPRWLLMNTGPQLLHLCAQEVLKRRNDIHVTYRDTRHAKWPYSGMMGPHGLVAFENTAREHYQDGDLQNQLAPDEAIKSMHYHELRLKGFLYTASCGLRNTTHANGGVLV